MFSSTDLREALLQNMIDPQSFLEWQRGLPRRAGVGAINDLVEAELTGTTGQRGRYHVIPIKDGTSVKWIEASGYQLARSQVQAKEIGNKVFRDDNELQRENGLLWCSEPRGSLIPRQSLEQFWSQPSLTTADNGINTDLQKAPALRASTF